MIERVTHVEIRVLPEPVSHEEDGSCVEFEEEGFSEEPLAELGPESLESQPPVHHSHIDHTLPHFPPEVVWGEGEVPGREMSYEVRFPFPDDEID